MISDFVRRDNSVSCHIIIVTQVSVFIVTSLLTALFQFQLNFRCALSTPDTIPAHISVTVITLLQRSLSVDICLSIRLMCALRQN